MTACAKKPEYVQKLMGVMDMEASLTGLPLAKFR